MAIPGYKPKEFSWFYKCPDYKTCGRNPKCILEIRDYQPVLKESHTPEHIRSCVIDGSYTQVYGS